MPDASGIELLLGQAGEREKQYDWLGAAELCRTASNLVPETDSSELGQVQERIGFAFYSAALQAESLAEFRDRMNESVGYFVKAKQSYEKIREPGKTPRISRCDAMIAYLGYWFASEASHRKTLINESWKLAKECLSCFEQVGDAREYGKTFNQLSSSIDLGFSFEWEFRARKIMIQEALERGEMAIRFLSSSGDSFQLATAYMKVATFLEVFGYYFVDADKEQHSQKAKDYVQKARDLSDGAFLTGMSSVLFGEGPGGFWGDGTDAAISNLEKALNHVIKTKDRFIIGCTLDLLKYHENWLSTTYDDREERRAHFKRALKYAEEARRQFTPISFISPCGGGLWVEGPYTQYYYGWSISETDLGVKRRLLEKALQVAPEELKRAEHSGYPEIIVFEHYMYDLALSELAKITISSEEKRELLEKALMHIDESCRISEQIESLNSWNVNLAKYDRAITKSGLADLVEDSETKRAMLQEAIIDIEAALEFCLKSAINSEREGTVALFSHVGLYQSGLGDLLIRLHRVSKNNEHLQRAVKAFRDAAESFEKLDRKSLVAECFWKTARVYGDLSNHLRAAEDFNAALDHYKSAAEKTRQLRDFYNEKALYMEAWSEIEKARYHHEKQEYGLAKGHFEKAAVLHRALKHLGYLAPNYSAWANVEQAEDLSRKEQCEDATQAFGQAVKLFDETRKSIKNELNKIEDPDEKQMATNIQKATDTRREYCTARIALEEAKMLDKKGDHYSSSEKYGSAVQILEKITETLSSEQEKKEFKLISTFSRAWQKMTLAEAEQSPDLYVQASNLFDAAKEFSTNERIKMLVLGHGRFCRALEAGTRFADTREREWHATIIQHLESASDYYMKAGFKNDSEYAKATGLLFDGYLRIDDAKKETDPEKRARFFMMAEKVLQTSASSFMKAEHPEKREQVLRLLENIREERELALSLNEMLHAPSIIAATAAFATPQPTQENAVGLERLEHADIQANLIIHQKELKIGDSLSLEIELINVGKGPALLTQITEIVPRGFELTEKPEMYRVEDSCLNMKGKRLDPLKIEEVKLALKPKIRGMFSLEPKILYLDENGKYKTHEPDPITITVKELGIKGWIKGEK